MTNKPNKNNVFQVEETNSQFSQTIYQTTLKTKKLKLLWMLKSNKQKYNKASMKM